MNPLGIVQHDETAGAQGPSFSDLVDSDNFSADVQNLFAHLQADPDFVIGNDPDETGAPEPAIGYARSILPVVTGILGTEVGADSPAASTTFTLKIVGGPVSGLTLTDGTPILLQAYDNDTPNDPTDDLILGLVDGGTLDGQVAFALHIDGAGRISIAQYLSLKHPSFPNNHDESISLNGKIEAVFTVTDSDGDLDSEFAEIGDHIRFDDDGPKVTVKDEVSSDERAALNLAFDELVQPDNGDNDTYDRYNTGEIESGGGTANGGTDDVAPSGQNYNQDPVVETAPDSNEAIGSRTSNVTGGLNALFNVTVSFGSDGPLPVPQGGSNPADGLSLNLTGSGQTNLVVTRLVGTPLEGLDDVARTVWLVEIAPGIVEGRIPGLDGLGVGNDIVAFRITITPDAQIKVDQFLPIDHDVSEPSGAAELPENPSLFDEQIALQMVGSNNTLQLVRTVTATDGDQDTASDDDSVTLISTSTSFVSFDDDGPVILSVVSSNPGAEQLINGSFNPLGTITPASFGFIATALDGWSISQSPTQPASTVQYEVVNSGYLNMSIPGGAPMLDMGASPGNIQISQTITALSEGQGATLQFFAGAPYPGTASLQVYWNGQLIDTIEAGASMQLYSYGVVGGSGNDVLKFVEVGTGSAQIPGYADEGYHGTYLGAVSLKVFATPLDDEDTTLSPAIENPGGYGDDGAGVVATGKINFDPGTDGLKSILIGGITGLAGIFVDNNGVGTSYAIDQVWNAGKNAAGVAAPGYENGGTLVGTMNTPEGPQVAFTIEVQSDGTYKFTLIAPLDHPLTNDPNTAALETSFEDNILLNFKFTITDGDNDTATGTLSFNVDDDLPAPTAEFDVR